MYKTSSFYYYTKYHFSILTDSICNCNLNFVHFILKHSGFTEPTFERPFMCLWLYCRISPSFSSTWFQSFGPSGNPWKEYFALVRSWGNACSLPWWLCERVEGASKGFVFRCVFETFQIKPVDPLIVWLEGFFSLRFGFSRLNKNYGCESAVWRIEERRIFIAQAPRGL